MVVVVVVEIVGVGIVGERVLVGFEVRFGVEVRWYWKRMDANDKEEKVVAEATIGESL